VCPPPSRWGRACCLCPKQNVVRVALAAPFCAGSSTYTGRHGTPRSTGRPAFGALDVTRVTG
jgi:hypothetical protein